MEKKTKLGMKSTTWFLRSSAIYFFISLIRSTNTTQPLIFDPGTVQVYNSEPGLSDPLAKYPFAVACPASSEEEKKFNNNISFDRKALFVKSYHQNQYTFPAQQETCETNFQLSAVFHRKNQYKEIQFGYEVYTKHPVPADSYESKYEDYGRVSEPGFLKRFNNAVMQQMTLALRKNKMIFIWIEKISVRYDYRNWNIKEVRYEIFRNADQMNVEKCTDYDFAKEAYGKENVDYYYSSLSKGMKENPIQILMTKYNLLLPNNFQATPSSAVSCSNLTTVPIWDLEAKTMLINLEHFLIAIGEITKNPLKIHSGIHGEIPLLRMLGNKIINQNETLHLDQKNNRILIPRYIYKIVRYQSYNCESKKKLCWFEIAIIIHNEPTVTKEHLLCPKDKCREWGWDKIQYKKTIKRGVKSERIYCCRFDETLKKKFGFTDKSIVEDLNLKDFPENYEVDTENHTYKDMQKDFEEKMDEVVSKSIFFEHSRED